MTTHVFVGPTLAAEEVSRLLPGAVVHPPIKHGDALRINPDRGDTLAVIDGLFFQSSAVRHKELLYLINRGVRVVGSSSMGALRAAELDRYGMRGVGAVYQAFARGHLDADDEVAVVHADADDGYVPCTDPMVNLRAAAERACHEGVVTPAAAAQFVSAAKSTFFAQRRAHDILRRCVRSGAIAATVGERFHGWLSEQEWDVKREDAELLLEQVGLGTWHVRFADPTDWRTERFPQVVHEWVGQYVPIDASGTTRHEALCLLQLFAPEAVEMVAAIGRRVLLSAWDLADDRLEAHLGDLGLTSPEALSDAILDHYVTDAERSSLPARRQAVIALARRAYPLAPVVIGDHSEAALLDGPAALAADIRRFNEELATQRSNFTPEHISLRTVEAKFATWWGEGRLEDQAAQRGFSNLHAFVAAARPMLPYVVAHGVPPVSWRP